MGGKALAGCALAAFCAAAAWAPAQAQAVSCGDTITTDTTLTEDLDCPSGSGLVIGAPDVTLDLGGHFLRGNDINENPDKSDTGIRVSGNYDGVTIKNGTVRDFDRGIYGSDAAGPEGTLFYLRVANIAATSNVFGIVLSKAANGTVEDTQANANTQTGVALVGTDGVTLQNIEASANNDSGVSGNSPDNLNLVDSTISNNRYQGVKIDGNFDPAQGNRYAGNTISGNEMILTGHHDAHVINNHVTGTGPCPECLGDIPAIDLTLGSSEVRGNVVTDSTGTGIRLTGSASTIVGGNSVFDSSGAGIKLGAENDGNHDIYVIRNSVGDSDGHGIDFGSAQASDAIGNVVFRSGQDGIHAQGANQALVRDNHITDTQDSGLYVRGDDVVVESNIVLGSGYDGIRAHAEDRGFVGSNTVLDSGHIGLSVIRPPSDGLVQNLSVDYNVVKRTGDVGISFADTVQVGAERNVVRASGGSGIDASDATSPHLIYNVVGASGAAGIEAVNADDAYIGGSSVSGSDGHGIHLAGSVNDPLDDAELSLNKTRTNAADGIHIGSNVTGAKLTVNESSGNGQSGYFVGDADATVFGAENSATGNALDGFLVSPLATGGRIRGARASWNLDDGLDVQSSSFTVRENRAVENRRLGIRSLGIDGGDNEAEDNGSRKQCLGVKCKPVG
ncbi:MAG: right-handed parallel beta-helix repeat-containing protein [Solirubrobacterales bacterium]